MRLDETTRIFFRMSAISSGFVFSAHGDHNLLHTKNPPDPVQPLTPKPSFREKLLGSSQEIPIREKEDMIQKQLVRIELEDDNRLLPKVYLEPKVFQELCTPWKDAIVVKLLGKNLGYNVMRDRLQKIWRLQGGFEIMDNDNGFYMVKFDQEADKEKVITGGPMLIFDHCLAVSHWSPEFASPDAKVDRTVVWVRFPGLNLVYYDESFLLAMASAIGRPIKVDTNTLKVERGKFARVCVEVDLTMPVVGKIWVNGHWYKVQYEGLHLICTNCGCYGHIGRNCTTTTTTTDQHKPPLQQTAASHGENHQPDHHIQATSQTQSIQDFQNGNIVFTPLITLSRNDGEITSNNEGNKNLHGDWLLVTRKKKTTNNSALIAAKTVTHKTNRYCALSHNPQKVKLGPSIPKLPPRPKLNDIARANQNKSEPKRRRSEETTTDPINFPFHGTTQNFKPNMLSHVAKTQKEISFTNYSTSPTPQSNTQVDEPIPTHEKNPNNTTMQMNNNQQPETSNNNLLSTLENNIVTGNNNMHIKQDNGDDKVESSTGHHDSPEEDMVT